MAFCGKHSFFCVVIFSCSGIALSFVELDCDKTTVGQFTHQSLLNCVVRPTQAITDIKIILVMWKKLGDNTSLLDYKKDERDNQKPGYRFAEPSWNSNNMNVSMHITNTKVEDEGSYVCEVVTNSGFCKGYISLNVTATYSNPGITLVSDKETPNADKALICRTSGGYPKGKLLWFVDNKDDWTSSSTLEVKKMDSGLLELSSTLPLLPGSTFSLYTCVVLGSSGAKESEISFTMNPDPTQPGAQKSSAEISNIIAGVVVIGSLIVGLLLVLLIRRRRSQQARRPSSTPLMDPHREIPTDDAGGNFPLDSKA